MPGPRAAMLAISLAAASSSGCTTSSTVAESREGGQPHHAASNAASNAATGAQAATPAPLASPGSSQPEPTSPAASPLPAADSTDGTDPGATADILSVEAALDGNRTGATIQIDALYLGWQGPCRGIPPTRSAWQLADAPEAGAACIYVDGPAPSGVSPTAAGAVAVSTTGVLQSLPDGEAYLLASKVIAR